MNRPAHNLSPRHAFRLLALAALAGAATSAVAEEPPTTITATASKEGPKTLQEPNPPTCSTGKIAVALKKSH